MWLAHPSHPKIDLFDTIGIKIIFFEGLFVPLGSRIFQTEQIENDDNERREKRRKKGEGCTS